MIQRIAGISPAKCRRPDQIYLAIWSKAAQFLLFNRIFFQLQRRLGESRPSTDSTQSPDIASVSGCGHSRKFRLANFFTSEYRAAHVTVLALKKDSRSARQIQSPDART